MGRLYCRKGIFTHKPRTISRTCRCTCQALADLLTIYEHKDKLKGTRVAFIGDGNNVASSLALACASVETEFYIATPTAYEIPHNVWQKALEIASLSNTVIEQMNSPEDAVRGADVVYTDVWASMGQEHERDKRIKCFKDYQVDETLMSKAKPNAIFMHDMPAHEGEEISPGMLYSDQSVVFLYSTGAIIHKNAYGKFDKTFSCHSRSS